MGIDPRVDVDPEENCALCGEPLLDEHKLVLVESGEMRPMKRDPEFLRFVPDRDRALGSDEDAILSLFHVHCVLERFDLHLNWGEEASRECWCEKKFASRSRVYFMQVGSVDLDTLVFVPDGGEKSTGLVCANCAHEGFGEGDLEEGVALLEATC